MANCCARPKAVSTAWSSAHSAPGTSPLTRCRSWPRSPGRFRSCSRRAQAVEPRWPVPTVSRGPNRTCSAAASSARASSMPSRPASCCTSCWPAKPAASRSPPLSARRRPNPAAARIKGNQLLATLYLGHDRLNDLVSEPLHRAAREDRGEHDVSHAGVDHFQEQGARSGRRLRIIAPDNRLHGADDLVWIASDGGAVLLEDLVPLPEFLGRPWVVPHIGVFGDDAQDAVARTADQDRWMGLL